MLQLDDKLLALAKNLPLLATQLVAGYMQGLHRSPFRGSSQEFAAYRQYMPGDAVRLVDWKVWARSDHLFVREFEEETNFRGYLFLDTSKSMDYGRGSTNKFLYARILSATLALLMRHQNDAPGLMPLGCAGTSDAGQWHPPSTRRDHIDHLMHVLQELRAEGQCDDLGQFSQQLEACANRSVSILISDGLFPLDQGRRFLDQLRMRNHNTLFFHLLSRTEMEPDFEEDMLMVDSETGRELPVDGLAMREPYQRQLDDFLARVREMCVATETEYVHIVTDEPLDEALHAYLELRANR